MNKAGYVDRGEYEACLGLAWQGLSATHRLLGLLASEGAGALWRASRARLVSLRVAGPAIAALEDARRCFDLKDAEALLRRAGLRFVPFGCSRYPKELLHLSLPPAGLFVLGAPEALDRLVCIPRVSIVGTRKASGEGLRATEAFTRAFIARDVAVISGMALGVDGRAHQTALEQGGLTVAVLGCGADVVYPPRHRWLYEKIARHGVVMSELPPGTSPARWTFPHRNRLLAALGDGVVVVEGAKTSGALQTADWALHLGRPVFSVPGSIFAESHTGCNLLLHQGAAPAVEPHITVEDFLTQTRIERGRRLENESPPSVDRGEDRSAVPACAGGTRGRSVLEALEAGPSTIDGLMIQTGLSARELGVAFAELELAGLVERAGPGVYIRAP